MTYIKCKKCNKRCYKSPYFKGKYSFYCTTCGSEEMNKDMPQKLVRTDNEEDYLDSTYCEYSQEEVEGMKQAKSIYLMRISKIREEIKEKYGEINKLDEKINRINTKLAVAEREQHLRKKLRRETRLLLPNLQNVQKNIDSVQKNLLSTLHTTDNNDDESSDSVDDEFIKEASAFLHSLKKEDCTNN